LQLKLDENWIFAALNLDITLLKPIVEIWPRVAESKYWYLSIFSHNLKILLDTVADMVSGLGLTFANYYLDTHKVEDHQLGLGPVLDRGEVSLRLMANSAVDGSLRVFFNPDHYVDCIVIAQRMYRDIYSNNPWLNPRMVSTSGGWHYWVDITDPHSKERISIDATPWYHRIDTGLVGSENIDLQIRTSSSLTMSRGVFLSVKNTAAGSISTALFGISPSFRSAIPIEEAFQEKRPEYTFVFTVTLFADGLTGFKDDIQIYVTVLSSVRLQMFIDSAKTLDDLVAVGAIEVNYLSPQNALVPYSSRARNLFHSLFGKADLFAEFERNIPRILTLLKAAKPYLQVDGTDLHSCLRDRTSFSFVPPLSPILPSDSSWQSLLPEFKAPPAFPPRSRTRIPSG